MHKMNKITVAYSYKKTAVFIKNTSELILLPKEFPVDATTTHN